MDNDTFIYLKIIIVGCISLAIQIYLYGKIGQDLPTNELSEEQFKGIEKQWKAIDEQWNDIDEQWNKKNEERRGSNNKPFFYSLKKK